MNLPILKLPRRPLPYVALLIGTLALSTPTTRCVAEAPAAGNSDITLSGDFAGKVVATMEAAGYTYVQVDTGKAKVWAAAPQLAVKVGDTLAVGKAMPMRNYHSKTLDRDFDVVYFTADTTVNGGSPAGVSGSTELPPNHPPITGTGSPVVPKTAIDLSGIKKAEGGKGVAEVFAEKAALRGKDVRVRGRVVKFNANIMGKNWIHIQDGTGKKGSNDLTVTSQTRAKVGDLILVNGKVTTDRDFGGNYKYSIIIEDAKVAVE